jgi:hypothetical protein
MSLADCEWLDDHVLVPEAVARAGGFVAHGGRVQHMVALDWLAQALGINPDRIRCDGYEVLRDLLERITPLLPTVPGELRKPVNLLDVVDEGTLDGAVAKTVSGLVPDQIVNAMVQFGWGHRTIPACRVDEVAAALEEALAKRLRSEVMRMLMRWDKLAKLSA